jgi:peptidoglycan L-alanyl-D-glutamate endopeptidase CwlK
MPSFGEVSTKRLATCHLDLQRLFNEVVKHFDCTVICGHRGEKEQEEACAKGNSKVHWPHGKHNSSPSNAVDVMPYPVNWSEDARNIEQITLFAGFVLGVAATMGIKVRWGHDWNRDMKPDTRGLVDRPHYELVA